MQEGGEDWARDGQDVEYPGSAQEELHDEWFVRTVDIDTTGLVRPHCREHHVASTVGPKLCPARIA